MAEHVVVGRIEGPHGVRGWVKVRSYMRPATNLLNYERLWIPQGATWRAVGVEDAQIHGRQLLISLEGVADRDAARALAGTMLTVERTELGASAPGEYYWADLIGLQVHTTAGEPLGRVEGLLETGAHDVLVIAGDRQYLIPFVMGVHIRSVDLDRGLIEADWSPEY